MHRIPLPLTNNDSRNGEEHESVSYKESFDVIFSDAPHPLRGQQPLGLHTGSDVLDPISGPPLVLPMVLSHSCSQSRQISCDDVDKSAFSLLLKNEGKSNMNLPALPSLYHLRLF